MRFEVSMPWGSLNSKLSNSWVQTNNNRIFNQAFQPNLTKTTIFTCCVEITCVATLISGQNGRVQLLCDSNSNPTTATGAEAYNENSVALALTITLTNKQRTTISYPIPPGFYAKLVTSGTGAMTIISQMEMTVG